MHKHNSVCFKCLIQERATFFLSKNKTKKEQTLTNGCTTLEFRANWQNFQHSFELNTTMSNWYRSSDSTGHFICNSPFEPPRRLRNLSQHCTFPSYVLLERPRSPRGTTVQFSVSILKPHLLPCALRSLSFSHSTISSTPSLIPNWSSHFNRYLSFFFF